MNTRRLAALFRQHAEISAEIAHALEEPEPSNDVPKRRRARIAKVVLEGPEPDELAQEGARQALRKLGYPVPSKGTR